MIQIKSYWCLCKVTVTVNTVNLTVRLNLNQNQAKVRIFSKDMLLDYEPENILKICRFPFRKHEGKVMLTEIVCKYCDSILVGERERKLLSLPSDDWEILQWGCPELKSNIKNNAKRTKKPKCNLLLHSALWIEIRDAEFWDSDEEIQENGKCLECDNYIGQKGKYSITTGVVTLVSGQSDIG